MLPESGEPDVDDHGKNNDEYEIGAENAVDKDEKKDDKINYNRNC